MSNNLPDRPAIYPLSYGQRALWFITQLAPDSAAYHIARALRFCMPLDQPALERSLQALVDRHPALRTTFTVIDDAPHQQVHADGRLCLRTIDAADWSRAQLDERMRQAAQEPFDVERGPLLRIDLFTRPDQPVMLVTIHHLVADFWSLALLIQELGQLYTAETTGAPAKLAPLRQSYADYVERQAALLDGPQGAEDWAYWQQQLGAGELPLLNLPTDRPRPPIQTYRGASHPFTIDAATAQALRALGKAQQATLYMTLLAAFQALLARYTGQSEALVGSLAAGRKQASLARIVGYFVNPLVLRADLSSDPTFTDFLAQVRLTVRDAFAHQDYPFALLAERIQPERDPSRPPLFQAMFSLQKAPVFDPRAGSAFALSQDGPPIELGALRLASMALEQRGAQFDLTLAVADTEEELAATFEYNTDLFDEATIARMAGHFTTLLAAIAADPALPVSRLSLIGAEERAQLLTTWNATAHDYDRTQTIDALIAMQAARTPDALALIAPDRDGGEVRLSYAELDARANQLAHQLRAMGVGPEDRVAVCLPRSADLLVALLATLKAGGCYVPLDPAYPAARLELMLSDSEAKVTLTTSELAELTPSAHAAVLHLDRDWPVIAQQPTDAVSGAISPQQLAYLIYTSGSTGRPKGVAITHANAVALLDWAQRLFSADELAGVLAATSICFDLSVYELFLPLTVGGAVILAQNVLALPTLPARAQVTLINTVPSAIGALLETGDLPATVRTVNLAGEALPRALAQQVYRQPHVHALYNLYGPSEDTTYSTWALVARDDARAPAIGRPIANTQAYVLDGRMQLTPLGVAGELYLGGDGLARGYLHRPALTAEKFTPDPFSAAPGARLYRTGDLARYRADGALEYLGRIDHQVKVRGFRIELDEISATLMRHPAVRDAATLAREDRPGDQRLVAYVVPEESKTTNHAPTVDESSSQFSVLSSELRTFLAQSLPDYMIPAAFVELDALPQTANGKLDRKALPAPAAERPELEQAFTAASTPTEQQLAAIWADVLGVAQVGVHDSFFELGGHSLLATKVLYRVQQSFGIEPPLHLFFEEPTIARLAAAIDQYQTRPATPSRPTITARARGRQSVDQLVSRLERPAGAPSPAPRERMRGAADHDEA